MCWGLMGDERQMNMVWVKLNLELGKVNWEISREDEPLLPLLLRTCLD